MSCVYSILAPNAIIEGIKTIMKITELSEAKWIPCHIFVKSNKRVYLCDVFILLWLQLQLLEVTETYLKIVMFSLQEARHIQVFVVKSNQLAKLGKEATLLQLNLFPPHDNLNIGK